MPARLPLDRSRLLLVILVAVIAVAAALLVTVAIATVAGRNLHAAVTINGVSVDRATLRASLAIDAALVASERSALESERAAGSIDPSDLRDRQAELDAFASDPVSAAIDGLVDDELIRQAATERAMSVTVDVGAELEAAATSGLVRRIAFVSLVEPNGPGTTPSGDWPRPAPADAIARSRSQHRLQAVERAGAALLDGTPVPDVLAGFRSAGWIADGDRRWIASAGRVAGIPEGLLLLLRDSGTSKETIVGPVGDGVHGRIAIGLVVEHGDAEFAPARDLVETHGLDSVVVRAWAEARALERMLTAGLVAEWQSQPQTQVRAMEVVVGSAALEGSPAAYVELAHIVVDEVPDGDIGPGQGSTPGERIAAGLRALDRTGREARFRELIDAANEVPTDDPLRRSGELSFFSRDQLIEPLATSVFAEGIAIGDVVGPVTTSVGEELFLVRARFRGVLDERANAALVEARTAEDLSALAQRISAPGDADRALGELWRSELEIGPDPAIRRAFLETPLGLMSDPIVLDGQLLVVRPVERRTAALDEGALDRLRVEGFETWLAWRRSEATIVIDPDPLGLGLPTTSPTAASSADLIATPLAPSVPASEPSTAATFAIPTPPRLP